MAWLNLCFVSSISKQSLITYLLHLTVTNLKSLGGLKLYLNIF